MFGLAWAFAVDLLYNFPLGTVNPNGWTTTDIDKVGSADIKLHEYALWSSGSVGILLIFTSVCFAIQLKQLDLSLEPANWVLQKSIDLYHSCNSYGIFSVRLVYVYEPGFTIFCLMGVLIEPVDQVGLGKRMSYNPDSGDFSTELSFRILSRLPFRLSFQLNFYPFLQS